METKWTEYVIEWVTHRGQSYKPRTFLGTDTGYSRTIKKAYRLPSLSAAIRYRQKHVVAERSIVVPVNCELAGGRR